MSTYRHEQQPADASSSGVVQAASARTASVAAAAGICFDQTFEVCLVGACCCHLFTSQVAL